MSDTPTTAADNDDQKHLNNYINSESIITQLQSTLPELHGGIVDRGRKNSFGDSDDDDDDVVARNTNYNKKNIKKSELTNCGPDSGMDSGMNVAHPEMVVKLEDPSFIKHVNQELLDLADTPTEPIAIKKDENTATVKTKTLKRRQWSHDESNIDNDTSSAGGGSDDGGIGSNINTKRIKLESVSESMLTTTTTTNNKQNPPQPQPQVKPEEMSYKDKAIAQTVATIDARNAAEKQKDVGGAGTGTGDGSNIRNAGNDDIFAKMSSIKSMISRTLDNVEINRKQQISNQHHEAATPAAVAVIPPTTTSSSSTSANAALSMICRNENETPMNLPEADEELYSAMYGDDPAAVELRRHMFNIHVGVSGLSNIAKIQSKMGTSIHNPSPMDLPHFRPQLRPNQVWGNLKPHDYIRVGVKEIYHRKIYTSPQSSFRNAHQLWLFGVLENGQSIDIRINGFYPCIYVLCGEGEDTTGGTTTTTTTNTTTTKSVYKEWSTADCLKLTNIINAKFSPEPNKNQKYAPADVIRSITTELRTPAIGFTNMRRDPVLKISINNACDLKVISDYLSNERGFRLLHDKWSLDQQFLHAMVKESPGKYSPDDERAWLDINVDNAVRLNRWINIRRVYLEMYTTDQSRLTTAQLQGGVYWRNIIPCPEYKESLPILVAYVDGEMISQHGYENSVNTFPKANNLRDNAVCSSVVFSVRGYSNRGSFCRLGFALGRTKPVPGCIIYSFDSEAEKLSAMRRTICEYSDCDAISGWNTMGFDLPYWADRATITKCNDFMKWNRFSADYCRPPNDNFKTIQMVGRWQLDLLVVAKDLWKSDFSEFSLRTVCTAKLKHGVNKVDLPYSQIPILYHDGGESGMSKLIFYCIVDSILCDMIDSAQNMLSFYLEICSLTNTTFMDLISKGQQIRVYNAIIEAIHHYRWYENKFVMHESLGYREVIPEGWDGWAEHNHIQQLLSRARDRGLIEPDTGYIEGDPRAVRRDRHWRPILEKSFDLGRSMDPMWSTLSAEQQARKKEEFIRDEMYEDDGVRKRNNKKRLRVEKSMKNQTVLGFKPIQSTTIASDDDGKNKNTNGDGDDDDGDAGGDTIPDLDTDYGLVDYSDSEVGKPGHKRKMWPGDGLLGHDRSVGGCVFRALRGTYDVLFAILDFASLYPSIMMADDVCYATLVREKRYLNLPGLKYKCVPYRGHLYWFVVSNPDRLSSKQYRDMMKSNPNYREPAPVTRSIIPPIQVRFVGERRGVKRKMEVETDPQKYNTLNSQQLALKFTCNGTYGFTNVKDHDAMLYPEDVESGGDDDAGDGDDGGDGDGDADGYDGGDASQPRLRMASGIKRKRVVKPSKPKKKEKRPNQKAYLACPPLAWFTTDTGRDMIRLCKYFAEVEEGFVCIYGDTDSIMITNPALLAIRNSGAPDAERQYEIAFDKACERICQRANDFFLHPHELENENACKNGFFNKKKMYSYLARKFLIDGKKKLILDADGNRIYTDKTKRTVKGMAGNKRDKCQAVRTLCNSINDLVMHHDVEPARQLIHDFAVALGRNEIPLKDLSISAAYNPATVDRALERPYTFLKESRRRGVTFAAGTRMQYILRTPEAQEKPYQRGEELSWAVECNMEADIDYYFWQQMTPAITTLIQFYVDPSTMFEELYAVMKQCRQEYRKSQQLKLNCAGDKNRKIGEVESVDGHDVDSNSKKRKKSEMYSIFFSGKS